MSESNIPSVVVIGGGTGTFMMLQSLKHLPLRLTALLTMVDDGGSNKVLRDQFGLLPTSGIRQCIVALSENDTLLRELFNYRFSKGDGIAGMTFGNLFMAALADIVGSQEKAIAETMKLLNVKGQIYPISYDDVRLVASYEDGTEVVGEHLIDEPSHDGHLKITDLRTEPKATIGSEAKKAIENADFILLGPGDFYTNTVANFVVEGVVEALKTSKAKKIFVTNLMTKFGETYNYTATTFLEELDRYYGLAHLDTVILNNNQGFPSEALAQYAKQNARPVFDDIDDGRYRDLKVLRADLLADQVFGTQRGDVLSRSILRHDSDKFARFFSATFLSGDTIES
jgi:uncharacterized cofD-like protein